MGKYNDLQIDANVPAMFAIMIAVSDYCLAHKKNVVTGVLITVILFSSIYSFKELKAPIVDYTLLNDNGSPISLASWSDLSLERNDYKFNYFTYDVENNLFIKYLANERWIVLCD